jgi:hypothetical protein
MRTDQPAALSTNLAPTVTNRIPAENARAWWRKARRVYPRATLRAWRFDWRAFIALCKSRELTLLPASPVVIRIEGVRPLTQPLLQF